MLLHLQVKFFVLLWGPLLWGPCSAEHAEHAQIRLCLLSLVFRTTGHATYLSHFAYCSVKHLATVEAKHPQLHGFPCGYYYWSHY